MNLGEKNRDAMLYPKTAASEETDKVSYPEVRLPLKLISELNLKVGDDIEIVIKGKLTGMEDTKWSKTMSMEAREGEVKSSSSKKSVLEGA